jgi:hypothetical protein
MSALATRYVVQPQYCGRSTARGMRDTPAIENTTNISQQANDHSNTEQENTMLSKIRIKNFRRLQDIELHTDQPATVIAERL